MLATLPTSTEDSSIVQQSVKAKGRWERKEFPRPGLIDHYNTFMGGGGRGGGGKLNWKFL